MPLPVAASPKPAPKPSRIVALACASVIAAYDRRWLAQPVAALLEPDDVAAETLSRLKGRLLGPLEALVAGLHRRGRRSAPSQTSSLRAELEATRAKLELAASVIGERGVQGRALQERLVAAQARLAAEHGTSLRDFCRGLGIPERTFRAWRSRKPAAPPAPPAQPPPRPERPPRNEGRFALELCPPDLQAMADTTHVRAFGVDLQLIGAQDPGRRHRELLSAFEVAEQDNAAVVKRVLTEALGALPGAQAIVDQGTPYIARATVDACEKLDVELEPQVEACPTDKAPLERAWRTIKQALAPLLTLTDDIAAAVPALRSPTFARAALALLVSVYLRVYAAGRVRLRHPLEHAGDPAALADAVARARDNARAESRSRKLFLQNLHATYNLSEYISVDHFVRAHRHHHLEDLVAAERILRDRACRCHARRCDRYFAGILSNVAEQGRRRRARDRVAREEQRRREQQAASFEQQDRFLTEHPDVRLAQALDALTAQWDERTGRLGFGGAGWARGAMVRALHELRDRAPLVWSYDVDAVVRGWRATTACSSGAQIAICDLLERERAKLLHTSAASPPAASSATIRPSGPTKTRKNTRPPPSPGLTI